MNIPCTMNKNDDDGNFVKAENGKIEELNNPICRTITCKEPGLNVHHSNLVLHEIEDKQIVAMRGRNPDNPLSRESGLPTEQRLEPNAENICNTLTSVQKDNMVLERLERQALETFAENECEPGDTINPFNKTVNKSGVCPTITTRPEGMKTAILPVIDTVHIKQATKEGSIECKIGGVADLTYPDSKTRRGRVQDGEDTSPTITAEGELCKIERYRIRKLTPRECWRLMGYTDADFDKAQTVNSNTQLYKQAGNAIVKQVLMAIFRQMNIHQEARSE